MIWCPSRIHSFSFFNLVNITDKCNHFLKPFWEKMTKYDYIVIMVDFYKVVNFKVK